MDDGGEKDDGRGGKRGRGEETLAFHQGTCLLCGWGALHVTMFSRGIQFSSVQSLSRV